MAGLWASRGASLAAAAAVTVGMLAGGWYWLRQSADPASPDVWSLPARLSADESDVRASRAARMGPILVPAGVSVLQGQEVGRLEAVSFEAALQQATASVAEAQRAQAAAAAEVARLQQAVALAQSQIDVFQRGIVVASRDLVNMRQRLARGEAGAADLAPVEARYVESRQLWNKGREELRAAQRAVDAAQGRQAAAGQEMGARQAEAARLQAGVQDSVLRAPQAGRIAEWRVAPGDELSAGQPLAAVVDLASVEVSIDWPAQGGKAAEQEDAVAPHPMPPPPKPGLALRVRLEDYPGHVLPAVVEQVSAQPEWRAAGTGQPPQLVWRVQARLDAAAWTRLPVAVRAGMRAQAYLLRDGRPAWPAELEGPR